MRTRSPHTVAFLIAALATVGPRAAESAAEDAAAAASDWVATFQCEPLGSLYYALSEFPEGLKQLIAMGAGAAEAIDRGLEDDDPWVRFTCAVAVNHMKLPEQEAPKACGWLKEGCLDEHEWVRTECVWGLGVVCAGSPALAERVGVVPCLLGALEDVDLAVRREARASSTSASPKNNS